MRLFIALILLALPCMAENTNKTDHTHEWQDGCIVASAHPNGTCLVVHDNPRRTCKTCWREEESINGEWVQVKAEEKAEKEKKTEHSENKMIVKEREKGSGAEWKTVKEYTLMFKNNRKARKPKDK